jgi:hypothetical protein
MATIDLQLSTVPVSSRTCLGFEKVQSCRPALLNMGVWKSVLSSSCCSGCRVTIPYHDVCQVVLPAMVLWSTGLYGSFDALCVCQINLVDILQVGYGFYQLGICTFGIIHLFQWDDTMNLEYCSLHISFSFDEIVSVPLKLVDNLIRFFSLLVVCDSVWSWTLDLLN